MDIQIDRPGQTYKLTEALRNGPVLERRLDRQAEQQIKGQKTEGRSGLHVKKVIIVIITLLYQ